MVVLFNSFVHNIGRGFKNGFCKVMEFLAPDTTTNKIPNSNNVPDDIIYITTRRNTYWRKITTTTMRTVTATTEETTLPPVSSTTEGPPKNFVETPEAVTSTNEMLLHYVLPVSICVMLVGVILLYFFLRRRRQKCSEGGMNNLNNNDNQNDVLYADLQLTEINSFQRKSIEESPYAQIQVLQTVKK